MYNHSVEQLPQFVADQGFTFEGHFRYGSECILARADAPKLYFHDSVPLEFVRDTTERWNSELRLHFPGTGYFAFSQADEMANPGYHVLVLFSDSSFCDTFMGNVVDGSLPPSVGAGMSAHFCKPE